MSHALQHPVFYLKSSKPIYLDDTEAIMTHVIKEFESTKCTATIVISVQRAVHESGIEYHTAVGIASNNKYQIFRKTTHHELTRAIFQWMETL